MFCTLLEGTLLVMLVKRVDLLWENLYSVCFFNATILHIRNCINLDEQVWIYVQSSNHFFASNVQS